MQPRLKRLADLEGPDFYPTPPWATYALIENEPFKGDIWECACGDGSMSKVLEETGNPVHSSDLYDRGYGESNIDFLSSTKIVDNIITNPPYNKAEEFLEKGLQLSNKKLALLLRLAFLEGAKRSNYIFNTNPPNRIWVFSERITFYRNEIKNKNGGTTAYAWFVWDKNYIKTTQLSWIKPGIKAKYL